MRSERISRLGLIVTAAALFVVELAPALLLPPTIAVTRLLMLCVELATLVGVLLPWLEGRPGRALAALRVVAVGMAVLGGLAFLLLAQLAPTATVVPIALGLLVGWLSRGRLRTRVLSGIIVTGSVAGQLFFMGATVLQDSTSGVAAAPRRDALRMGEITHMRTRYYVLPSTDGSKLLSCMPRDNQCEVFDVASYRGEPERVMDFGINRAVISEIDDRIYAAENTDGLLVLDRADFGVVYEPPKVEPKQVSYMGVVRRHADDEVLLAVGDGWLLHMSPDGVERSRFDLFEGETIRFNEELHNIYLSRDEQQVVAVTNGGRMFVYDPVARRVTAHRRLLGAPGNVVFPADGETIYVAVLSTGEVQHLRLHDLSQIRGRYLGTGHRYLRLTPDGEGLLVANYFTGLVTLLDTATLEPVARVHAGPRIQWVELHPDGESFWVSHSRGLSRFDLAAVRELRPFEDAPDNVLTATIWSPALLTILRERERVTDASVVLSLLVVLATGWILARSRREEAA